MYEKAKGTLTRASGGGAYHTTAVLLITPGSSLSYAFVHLEQVYNQTKAPGA